MIPATTLGQPPAEPDPSVIGGPVNEAYGTAAPVVENQTGEEITSESIDLQVLLDIQNAELEIIEVLFGGGKVQTDLDARVHLAFRAVAIDRIEPALRSFTGDANITLQGTFGINSSRTVLTAEEIRTAGGGALLEAFRAYQESATKRLVESTVPGVQVLATEFQWSNTAPGEEPREGEEPSLTEPPLILDARVAVRYLDRYSLAGILETQAAKNDTEDDRKTLQERIEENQTVPLTQRDAFMVLGIGQLLSLDLPPGWRLNLTIAVPQGFTIAGATDALAVSEDKQIATYYMDGSRRSEPLTTNGVITVSNRFLVTSTVFIGVFLAGILLRIPVEMGAFALHRRLTGDTEEATRAGEDNPPSG